VALVHQFAMENQLVEAEMIEANEFYDLAMRYNVSGVPQTVINEGAGIILGAVPDIHLLQEMMYALKN
jgi:hypothetical protein